MKEYLLRSALTCSSTANAYALPPFFLRLVSNPALIFFSQPPARPSPCPRRVGNPALALVPPVSAARGIAIGNLSSSNVLLTDHLWVQIAPSVPPVCVSGDAPRTRRTLSPSSSSRRSLSRSPLRRGGFSTRNIVGREEISEKEKKRRWRRQQKHERPGGRLLGGSPRPPPGEDLPLTYRWVKGMVTNLEYLLAVNTAAGRFLGDRSCHPIVPWVSDLSCRLEGAGSGGGDGEGWRDLTMTKFRLKKGDVQVRRGGREVRARLRSVGNRRGSQREVFACWGKWRAVFRGREGSSVCFGRGRGAGGFFLYPWCISVDDACELV